MRQRPPSPVEGEAASVVSGLILGRWSRCFWRAEISAVRALWSPGGGRPADGFTVKASVTALRYCGEDSPQFPKMVAEVWFRSAADAERVGFRPLH
ncbi:sunset domain-containing protein [Amycolatopsis sp. NPDC003676]